MSRRVRIGSQEIGNGNPVFICAEAGVNHNGRLDLAKNLVDEAIASGADAIKFQSFKADLLVTKSSIKAPYQQETTNSSESQYQMLKKLELNFEEQEELLNYARSKDIEVFSTPYDFESLQFLIDSQVSAIKLASADIISIPLLRAAAESKLPLILSTGMATLGEICLATETAESMGNKDLILLHCTTNYPAPPKSINLRVLNAYQHVFPYVIGFSDHSEGIGSTLGAITLGAKVIERHFTLSKTMKGPDHSASSDPKEFSNLVKEIRCLELALGKSFKKIQTVEEENRKVMRRSLVAQKPIGMGHIITPNDIGLMRPGDGLLPTYFDFFVGKRARKDVEPGSKLTWDLIIE